MNASVTEQNVSKLGLLSIGITGGVAVVLSIGCFPFISPALRRICLPFVPATASQVQNVLSALSGRKGKLIDLGSGDGRIVIATAKFGFTAHGVEINPLLIYYSRWQAFRQGVQEHTYFLRKDLWKIDLTSYQNVVIFGVQEMMPELKQKLTKELENNSVVVACRFPFPNWTPVKTCGSGIDTVWVYHHKKETS